MIDEDIEDGATEVVDHKPLRLRKPMEPGDIRGVKAGGRLKAILDSDLRQRQDFMLLRRQGQSPVKMAMSHALVFKTLWSVWLKKRLAKGDLTTTTAELQAILDLPLSSVVTALNSLTKNGMVRRTEELIGWQGKRYRYVPTRAGVELLAIAEYLGEGALVQIGRKTTEWNSPSSGEPGSLFDFAALFRGGTLDG